MNVLGSLADRTFFHLLYLGGLPLVRAAYPIRVRGSLPTEVDRPVLLAPNHASFLDPIVLQAVVPRRITYLMAEAYYRLPLLQFAFRRLGCIPIRTSGANVAAIRSGVDALRETSLAAIFPEGRRSLDGELQPGFPGVAILAERADALVVPVGILGTWNALPPGGRFPRPAAVEVRFGSPIDFRRSVGPRVRVRERTAIVMRAIDSLLDA